MVLVIEAWFIGKIWENGGGGPWDVGPLIINLINTPYIGGPSHDS